KAKSCPIILPAKETVFFKLLFIGYALQTIGCKYTTAGKNAFLTAVYVVLVPFLHRLINHQKTKRINIIAGLIALLGIGLISLRRDFSVNIGDMLTLMCGFAFATHMVYVAKYTADQDPVLLTMLQLGAAAVMSWVFAPIIDGGFPAEAFHTDIIGSMLYLGLMSTMVGFLLQNVCQKYTSPSTAAIMLSTESVFGIIFSIIFLAERPGLRMAVGCGFIFVAIILSQLNSEKTAGYNKQSL
ncbi:MAG: DMT family transporter, partial [Oscillospiraceae bacterium]|nr:DMT family transporter [Oscillospiraceae bacterium]